VVRRRPSEARPVAVGKLGVRMPEAHGEPAVGSDSGTRAQRTVFVLGKRQMATIGLLVISNVFMTIAWYGHLKDTRRPLLAAILISWGIAFFEYVFQVPANRIGYGRFTLTQLKIIQECVTLCVFTAYAFIVFHQRLQWNYLVAYALIVGAVYFAFRF
jgi:uncharacterized protein (DUF486 family)